MDSGATALDHGFEDRPASGSRAPQPPHLGHATNGGPGLGSTLGIVGSTSESNLGGESPHFSRGKPNRTVRYRFPKTSPEVAGSSSGTSPSSGTSSGSGSGGEAAEGAEKSWRRRR